MCSAVTCRANGEKSIHKVQVEIAPWYFVLGILVLQLLSGCVKTAPNLPPQTAPPKLKVRLIDLRSSDSQPAILYQRPPKGFVDGFFRGAAHGAVLGGYVGKELAKAFIQQTPEKVDQCDSSYHRGGCEYIYVIGPVMGALALVTIPPLTTVTAGIQGGFTAYSKAEVEAWEKALNEAHEQLKMQTTFREEVLRSLSSCCSGNVLPLYGDLQIQTSMEAITILETEVMELGLVEASAEKYPEPDENSQAIDPVFAKATVPLNAIFKKSRSSMYLLVQTRLLKADDRTLIDQRQFGYLSTPRPYMEWSAENGSRFRAELRKAYKSLAEQISDKLVKLIP